VREHFGKVKQTKSNEKEVISGNMSHTMERIKIRKVLFTTQKGFQELTHALQGRI